MLEVFYRKVGGDYSNVLYRLENDETILLFLEKFCGKTVIRIS